MAEWTEGPWVVDGPPHNQIIWSSPENRVCFMAHSNGADPARDIATAHLIAAAPDLYEQLAELVADLGPAGADGWHNTPVHSQWVKKANAALSRARGGAA